MRNEVTPYYFLSKKKNLTDCFKGNLHISTPEGGGFLLAPPPHYPCKAEKMRYFLGHTKEIYKKSDKKSILCKTNPCYWACFQNVKNQKRKKISFFDSVYLTAKSTNYARYQGESLLVEIWRFSLSCGLMLWFQVVVELTTAKSHFKFL